LEDIRSPRSRASGVKGEGSHMTFDEIKRQIARENLYGHQPVFEQRTNERILAIIEAIESQRDDSLSRAGQVPGRDR